MSLEQDLKIIKNAGLDIELLNRENDKKCAENNEEIANLQEKIKSTEFIVEEELKASGKDKLECKFDGYKGSISWQKMPDKWIYIDEVLMKFIMSLPAKFSSLFYKVTTTIRKADLKKKIIADNFSLFDNGKIVSVIAGKELFIIDELETCREVKGIEIEPQERKFKYSIKKIK